MKQSKLCIMTLTAWLCAVPVLNPVHAEDAAAGALLSVASAGFTDKYEITQMNSLECRPRNPFAAPVAGKSRNVEVDVPDKKEIVFDGSSLDPAMLDMRSVRWDHVPRIRVTGFMEVNGEITVCAEVADMGMTVLRANERVLIGHSGQKQTDGDESSWFLVKQINRRNMTIQLDDGTVIQGKFF